MAKSKKHGFKVKGVSHESKAKRVKASRKGRSKKHSNKKA